MHTISADRPSFSLQSSSTPFCICSLQLALAVFGGSLRCSLCIHPYKQRGRHPLIKIALGFDNSWAESFQLKAFITSVVVCLWCICLGQTIAYTIHSAPLHESLATSSMLAACLHCFANALVFQLMR